MIPFPRIGSGEPTGGARTATSIDRANRSGGAELAGIVGGTAIPFGGERV
ncbi:hypothetical protein ACFPM1_15530 [Halorubrum rubrum]|uniref:Uncharacterized protein n=1 Tax=Halorubrum rubrum TaxID=1126240 RepID=A0ABD5R5E4_9EURY|nr:hypothetical protein [Halorubrum rubrum]